MAKQLSEHTRLVDKKGRNQVSATFFNVKLTNFCRLGEFQRHGGAKCTLYEGCFYINGRRSLVLCSHRFLCIVFWYVPRLPTVRIWSIIIRFVAALRSNILAHCVAEWRHNSNKEWRGRRSRCLRRQCLWLHNRVSVRTWRPNNHWLRFTEYNGALCPCNHFTIHTIPNRNRPWLTRSHHCLHKGKRISYLLTVTHAQLQLARPKNRAKTVQFSKHAVICERDGELCLIVRAVNLRASLLIDVSVTGEG